MGDGRWNTTMKVYNEQSDRNLSEQLKEIQKEIRKKRNFNPKDYIEQKSNLLNEYMNKYVTNNTNTYIPSS